MNRILGVAVATACMAGLSLGPASAKAAEPLADQPETMTYSATVTVSDYTSDHKHLVSRGSYDESTQGHTMSGPAAAGITTLDASGTGGGSGSASGCRVITTTNTAHTSLGFTAFTWETTIDYCWNRAAQTVTKNTTYERGTNVDSQHQWDGSWRNYAGTGSYYPENSVNVAYNGTWSWWTKDN